MVLKADWQDDVGDQYTAAHANAVADAVNAASAALPGKVDAGRKVQAGTGLTGGGDLTADRTLAADFGSVAGKVCEGSDPRLSDARTPTSHTHTITQVSGLDTALADKASASDLASGLAGKRDVGWSVSSAASGDVAPVAGGADDYNRTALTAACTISNPSGTAVSGQRFTVRLKDNGTARALTWGSAYAGSPPSTTTVGKTLKMGFMYDEVAASWVMVAKFEY